MALIRAPFTAPPKPVQLPVDYIQLPLQVPETRLTEQDLDTWIKECETVKTEISNYGKQDIINYNNWHDKVVSIAPGYTNDLLKPQKRETKEPTINESLSSLNIN